MRGGDPKKQEAGSGGTGEIPWVDKQKAGWARDGSLSACMGGVLAELGEGARGGGLRGHETGHHVLLSTRNSDNIKNFLNT